MTLISTPTLKKITIVVLVIAIVSFGATQIHQRFFVPTPLPPQPEPPSQEQPVVEDTPLPSPSIIFPSPPPESDGLLLVLGTIDSISGQSFVITTLGEDLQITFSSQTTFYTTSKPGCDIKLNPGCEDPIVPSTKEEVLQEGKTVTIACEKAEPNSFNAVRVTLVTSL